MPAETTDARFSGERLPTGAPRALFEALAEREARPSGGWREHSRFYARAESPGGPVFARWSLDEDDIAVLEHEVAVRLRVGSEGPLRCPQVLASGPGWLVERAVEPEPWTPEAVEGVVAAAARIAALELPEPPRAAARRSASLRRRLVPARRPLLVRELLRARRIVSGTELPQVTAHGDFHAGNVLVAGGSPWIVDWELSGHLPAGYDLMHFWATAPEAIDREQLFEGAVEVVGRERRQELARLGYAVLVRAIAGKLAAARSFDRDEAGARRLLRLLPAARRGAGL